MIINNEVRNFLLGNTFSNGAPIGLAESEPMPDRISYLADLVKGKRVVHVGFADHIPLVGEKIARGIWLHRRLLDTAAECIGIDIDKEAVEVIGSTYNVPDLHHHDVINDAPLARITSQQWDYFILGEVLEHIDNPVTFLTEIRKKYGPYTGTFVITVPNAWDWDTIRGLLKGAEWINTDHRFYFTPYTLAKVCTRAGFNVEECRFISGSTLGIVRRNVFKRFPFLRSGLVIQLTDH